jgi:hypothetical protein
MLDDFLVFKSKIFFLCPERNEDNFMYEYGDYIATQYAHEAAVLTPMKA